MLLRLMWPVLSHPILPNTMTMKTRMGSTNQQPPSWPRYWLERKPQDLQEKRRLPNILESLGTKTVCPNSAKALTTPQTMAHGSAPKMAKRLLPKTPGPPTADLASTKIDPIELAVIEVIEGNGLVQVETSPQNVLIRYYSVPANQLLLQTPPPQTIRSPAIRRPVFRCPAFQRPAMLPVEWKAVSIAKVVLVADDDPEESPVKAGRHRI